MGQTLYPSHAQIVEWLQALDPLQKVHYSWPLPTELLDNPDDARLFQYVRLTHAASVRGEWCTSCQIDTAVLACKQVNATNPSIPATLAINYSPWHRKFGAELPPTDTGVTHDQEIAYFRERMSKVKKWLADANALHGTDVSVSSLLLDSERFVVEPGNTAWNNAMTAKYQAIYDVGREIFPGIPVHWYNRGGWARDASTTGWSETRRFTLDEPGDSFSCSLYRIPELGYTRDTFRRTVDNATTHSVADVVPWVALGSGYRRQTNVFQMWSAWDYDLIYSWQLGREINHPWYGNRPDRFAPWNAAKAVVFYPSPFSADYPAWPKHFVAYVRGANGATDMSDIAGAIADCNSNGTPDSYDIASSSGLDCDSNGQIDLCELSAGFAADCNTNGVPDSCDIESNPSTDCNGNGRVDLCEIAAGCEPDCNANGIIDVCETAASTAADCNSNSIPDSCDIASNSVEDCDTNGIPDSCKPAPYVEDFELFNVGTIGVPGWVDTESGGILIVNDSIFDIATPGVGTTQAFHTANTGTNIHSHYTLCGSEGWATFEYTGKMRISDANGGVGVTFLSGYPNATTYHRLRRYQDTTAFHISPSADVNVPGGDRDTGVIPVVNTWYEFHIEVTATATSTTIKANVWQAGTNEPSGWQADCTDNDSGGYALLKTGTFGVWSMGAGDKYWDDLSVTTLP